MSIPSPYIQRNSPNDVRCKVVSNDNLSKENCRDFLRTGRCKYGASCKYNHPPNVQSGGGMKAPIDPSEPLFPVRYNEPVCQYYMKHGTCKFGQACKFHHPPQIMGTSNSMNGNTLLVSIPLGCKEDNAQTIWETGNNPNTQLLPQRPDEPNCLYFLKNGRCKYGASCRYHHPLNYNGSNDRRGSFENGRNRQQHQDPRSTSKVHYVTALPPGSMQQGHFVVADGTVTFLSLDGNTPAHVVSIPHSTSAKDVSFSYTTHGTVGSSSTSSTSIASSFETPLSNMDAHDSFGSLWNPKAGGNTTNSYGLPRVVSTGTSQTESNNTTMYFNDTNCGPPSWRGKRSSSFDHTRPRSSSLSNTQEDDLPRSASVHSGLDDQFGRPPRSSTKGSGGDDDENLSTIHGQSIHQNTRIQHPPGEVIDGLSMMTSALLTMLDTTEDVDRSVNQVQQGCDFDEHQDTRPHNIQSVTRGDSNEYQTYASAYNGQDSPFKQEQNVTCYNDGLSSEAYHLGESFVSSHQEGQDQVNQIDRISSWQGSASAGVIHENSQFSSMGLSQPSSSPNFPTNNNIGLFY